VAAARPLERSLLSSNSGERRGNKGEQMAVEALLGLRGGVQWLGRWWKRAEMLLHRGGGNGEQQSACTRGEPCIGRQGRNVIFTLKQGGEFRASTDR
jgi:hypothetical protein